MTKHQENSLKKNYKSPAELCASTAQIILYERLSIKLVILDATEKHKESL